jgi:hypothetical protein
MSADRTRRRTIICKCCSVQGAHRGHGWCVACYARWIYHGRPASGPPKPGTAPRRPNSTKGRKIRDLCINGHSRAELDPGQGCPDCGRDRSARHQADRTAQARDVFTIEHAGHEIGTKVTGAFYCRTCLRGEHTVDEIAVERAISGDPPTRLSPAERDAAVLYLRNHRLLYRAIAERVGCSTGTAWLSATRTASDHR